MKELDIFDYETRKMAIPEFSYNVAGEPEMTEFESAFLCGLLEKYKPKKIVEIGVAAGGTTAIILKKLENREDVTMYSCDLSEKVYTCFEVDGVVQKSGFLAKDILKTSKVNHKFLLGDYYVSKADEIGDGIDFAIIDTVHFLPGEILDYLAIFPRMKDGGVIVLHDICYNVQNNHYKEGLATNVLFNSISGDKILNMVPEGKDGISRYPNIGAVLVNKETKKYVNDLFCSFMVTWHYLPEKDELILYRNDYKKHYDQKCIDIFDEAEKMQKKLKKEKFTFKDTFRRSLSVFKQYFIRKYKQQNISF